VITSAEKERIHRAVDVEYIRSLRLYGNWDDMNYSDMHYVIGKELKEVESAIYKDDHHGAHGTLTELAQVAACVQKAMVQIIRREGEP